MFYPFMPGRHDRLAVTLSSMAQVAGVTGLLMVPIGILWLAHELRMRRARQRGSAHPGNMGYWLAFSAIGVSAVVIAGVALTAAIHTGPSLAVVVLALWIHTIRRALVSMSRTRSAGHSRVTPAPLYLIVVPCCLFLARLWLLPSAVEFSRRSTIEGSARFIGAIEGYRVAHGRYPLSLASVHHDYDPPTVGVERYYYEPYREAYNVFFEQPTFPIGVQEFVMYNPADEHAMIVHNQDLLESPPEQVERERAFHARAARDAGARHWRYFWFD
jgi:hypothetical protein